MSAFVYGTLMYPEVRPGGLWACVRSSLALTSVVP